MTTDHGNTEEAHQTIILARIAASYFEKFDRYDLQELLAYSSTNWMLSSEDFRLPTDQPVGLIRSISLILNFCKQY